MNSFKIIPLSEGAFTVDQTKQFVPFNQQYDVLQNRPIGSLLVEVQPFCIIANNDIIVIDTGLGFSKNGRLQIHQNLTDNGIAPENVTKVLMSHLHKDHAGGIAYQTESGDYSLTFPNATYYIQQREFEFALKTGAPSFITDNLNILKENSKVFWLNYDDGTIDNYIQYEVTAAHSPFHQVFWINVNSNKIFFGGDDAPQLQQMKSRFIAKYDYNGKKCMELRRQWWEQGNENWTFLFYHDIQHPMFSNR